MHPDFERRHVDVSILSKDLVDSGQRGSAMDYLTAQTSRYILTAKSCRRCLHLFDSILYCFLWVWKILLFMGHFLQRGHLVVTQVEISGLGMGLVQDAAFTLVLSKVWRKPRSAVTLFVNTFFTTVLSQYDFSHGKLRLLFSGKASCNRVALPNLLCILGVLVFP